ncbi:MarR family transcriptional regulator [Paraflavisolibacter sp. H34]|uniref:MarR family winged helix-turn-helix transcriptional regulator n=1 Tax=Huijunlia imazamoxiresistens TaxID=3127457 RepID=UPI00301B4589
MGIEKDIHQDTFVSIHQKAMINVLFSYGWIMERIKNFLAHEDITPQQFNILRILSRSLPEPLSTMRIRERMIDKMSDTSRIVDRLVAKELVRKEVSAKDRRLVDVTITPKGVALLKVLEKVLDQMDEMMSNLTDEEARLLSNLLDKLRCPPSCPETPALGAEGAQPADAPISAGNF